MLLSILVFLAILSVLVLSHEFGHFITARKLGMKVEEFGLGFPPRIFGKKIGKTLYSLNAILFGGFVRIYGEDATQEAISHDPESFSSKPISSRLLVLVAGVVANILFAIIIFYFLLGLSGFASWQNIVFNYQFPLGHQKNFSMISFVAKHSPADKAGLRSGDIITQINEKKIIHSSDVIKSVKQNKGKEIVLRLKNLYTKSVKEVRAIPRVSSPKGEGPLGIGLTDVAKLSYPSFLEKASSGFLHSFNMAHYTIVTLGHLIKVSFQENTIKPLASSVTGPVGILAITELSIRMGFLALLNMVGLLSLALAMANLLPLPALDGGRIVFLGYEFLARKKVSPRLEERINLAGLILLILLSVLVAYKDILQFKSILF